MSSNPAGQDQNVNRSRREGGTPVYPFIILVVLVVVAAIGIYLTVVR